MEVLYNDGIEINNICNGNIKLASKSVGTYYDISIGIIGNNYYIVKINNNKNEAEVTTKIAKKIKNIPEHYLFSKYRGIVKCQNIPNKKGEYMYLMEDIVLSDLSYLLTMFNKKTRISFLFQSLVAIYILNHKIGYYHNDLYHKSEVRNIMIDDLYNKNIKIKEYNFENTIKIPINSYCIRIIDFGWADENPKFRTEEYYNKYFSGTKYKSEIVIFTYVYFLNMKKDILKSLLKKIKKIEDKTNNRKEFDLAIIKEMFNVFSKYL